MNIGKFSSLYDLLEAFPTEESCIKYLEQQRWANGIPVSPYDPTSKVYNRSDGMYRCKNTGKNLNVRIGTMQMMEKGYLSLFLNLNLLLMRF